MFAFAFFGVILLVMLVLLAVHEREAKKQRVAAAAAAAEKANEALAYAFIAGGDPQLWMLKTGDPALRTIQVIGQSIEFAWNSKNRKTRESRVEVAQKCLAQLDEDGGIHWCGLSADVQAHVRAAVTLAAQIEPVITAIEVATKHGEAAERATRSETRRKHCTLGLASIDTALQGEMPDKARAELERLAQTFKTALAEEGLGAAVERRGGQSLH